MDAQKLKDIFYSGYNVYPEWEVLDELSSLINNRTIFNQFHRKNI